MSDLVAAFLAESAAGLAGLKAQLAAMQRDGQNHGGRPDVVGGARRVFAVAADACARLGLPQTAELAKAAETALADFGDDKAVLSADAVGLVELALDRIRLALQSFEATAQDPPADNAILVAALGGMAAAGDAASASDRRHANAPGGAAALIAQLDGMVAGLATTHASLAAAIDDETAAPRPAEAPAKIEAGAAFLVFLAGVRLAAPLSRVAWLEDLPRSGVDRRGDRATVRRNGAALPVLVMGAAPADATVIVCKHGDVTAGLVVDRIVDIARGWDDFAMEIGAPGALGRLTVDGEAIRVIDVDYYLEQARPGWRADGETAPGAAAATPGARLAAALARKSGGS